jgi:hypothetical protein
VRLTECLLKPSLSGIEIGAETKAKRKPVFTSLLVNPVLSTQRGPPHSRNFFYSPTNFFSTNTSFFCCKQRWTHFSAGRYKKQSPPFFEGINVVYIFASSLQFLTRAHVRDDCKAMQRQARYEEENEKVLFFSESLIDGSGI